MAAPAEPSCDILTRTPKRGSTMSFGYQFLTRLLITGASFGITLYASGLTQSCSTPQFPEPGATKIDSAGAAVGSGGKDANQNQAKSKYCAPSPSKPIAIPDM